MMGNGYIEGLLSLNFGFFTICRRQIDVSRVLFDTFVSYSLSMLQEQGRPRSIARDQSAVCTLSSERKYSVQFSCDLMV